MAVRLESSNLRRSKAIVGAILIEFPMDWCIKQGQQWVRRHGKKKKWRRSYRHKHLPCQQKIATTQVVTSTPLQSYCRDPHWIPYRLMYYQETGAKMGEKTLKEEKVTPTKNQVATRLLTSTPLQSYCHDPHHWIPYRLMYQTGATMGEKTLKEEKVTATIRGHQMKQKCRHHFCHDNLPVCKEKPKIIDHPSH